MADFRYLLAIYVHAHQTGNSVPPHIDAAARAALAASPATDEPAVPEGREPAAVDPDARALIERVAKMADRIGQHTISEITEISDQAAAWLQENLPGQSTAPAPMEGEVGWAVDDLHQVANALDDWGLVGSGACLSASDLLKSQAAELAALRTRAALVPVPVAERPWEREGWCDAEGRCWFMEETRSGQLMDWTWLLTEPDMAKRPAYCLPHWAIAQPPQGGEVEQ